MKKFADKKRVWGPTLREKKKSISSIINTQHENDICLNHTIK